MSIASFTARRSAVAAALAIAAAAALPASAQAQEIRISFAHSLSTTEPAHQAAEHAPQRGQGAAQAHVQQRQPGGRHQLHVVQHEGRVW